MTNGLGRTLYDALVALLFTASALSGCAAPEPQKTNVILLVIGQLQADRLHCYCNPRWTSPIIDRLAAARTRFSRFYSVAP